MVFWGKVWALGATVWDPIMKVQEPWNIMNVICAAIVKTAGCDSDLAAVLAVEQLEQQQFRGFGFSHGIRAQGCLGVQGFVF